MNKDIKMPKDDINKNDEKIDEISQEINRTTRTKRRRKRKHRKLSLRFNELRNSTTDIRKKKTR